jgi:hypothetical protein
MTIWSRSPMWFAINFMGEVSVRADIQIFTALLIG